MDAASHYPAIRAEIEPQLRQWLPETIALDTLLLLAVDDEKPDEAGRLLAQVPDTAADDPVFWRYRGWYAARIGDLEQAEQSYRQALELHPLGWQTRAELANVLRLRGRGAEAAAMQSIATKGSELVAETRRLSHAKDVDSALRKRIAEYAISCKSTEIANGILRRQKTSEQ
jgi:Flp pilus assembly protein TadD